MQWQVAVAALAGLLLLSAAPSTAVGLRAGREAVEAAAQHVQEGAAALAEEGAPQPQGGEEATLSEVDYFVRAEKEALGAQQAALEALAAEQAALAAQQELAEAAHNRTEAEVQRLRSLSLLETGASGAARLRQTIGLEPMSVWEELLAVLVYVAFHVVVGQIYGMYFTREFPLLRKQPRISRVTFTFGLFDACDCDPDWRICCCSCFCQPVRWADTASNLKIRFVHFWPGIIIWCLLAALGSLSRGVTSFLLLLIVVQNRQRIREVYGLPHGSLATFCLDGLTWIFCGPCATMQEAMEVEFIEPPLVHIITDADKK